MTVYLVRHAKAGSRSAWDGPDEVRPVSTKGARQARAIADLLAGEPIKRILSSPYARCVGTVQPLADRLGLVVEVDGALAEGAPLDAGLALLGEVAGDHAVLCSHGDVIPALLEALARSDGLTLPRDFPFAKGSTWVLEGEGPPFASARYLPPPA